MILGDLLDTRVLAHDGAHLGHVVDVRLALEVLGDREAEPAADHDGAEGALADRHRRSGTTGQAEVVGLLVSPRTGTSFLGYERCDIRSPWLVATIVRRLHRGTFLVPWADVAAIDSDQVRLVEGFRRQDPALP